MIYANKPNVVVPKLPVDPDTARFYQEVAARLGIGISVQTTRARTATIKLNEDIWKLEATIDDGKTWRVIG